MAAKKTAASVGASALALKDSPYVQRLVEDAELRENIREAYESLRKAYGRLSNGKAPAKAIFDDKKLQKELRTAAVSLRDAGEALREGPKRRKQAEAGLAFGMSNTRVYLRIILPQMVRLAIPGFTNNWLVLVKCTALVSIIGLEDIMFKARGASEATRQPFTFYLVTALVYLAITTVSMLMLRWLEKKYSMGFKPANFS